MFIVIYSNYILPYFVKIFQLNINTPKQIAKSAMLKENKLNKLI